MFSGNIFFFWELTQMLYDVASNHSSHDGPNMHFKIIVRKIGKERESVRLCRCVFVCISCVLQELNELYKKPLQKECERKSLESQVDR